MVSCLTPPYIYYIYKIFHTHQKQKYLVPPESPVRRLKYPSYVIPPNRHLNAVQSLLGTSQSVYDLHLHLKVS